ncbi:hypothetical protein Dxin01_02882 [Deinococcus xinjiangensis]|uniref:Uncharacterized protein n=1 Tax=Deinococcus xinjiangensis TaxID=457454 RepID=A0ABP9VGD0_9DEIO
MRIKTRSIATQLQIDGTPVHTAHAVSVVGLIPGLPAIYIEREVGLVDDPAHAPALTGQYLTHYAAEPMACSAMQRYPDLTRNEATELLKQGELKFSVPSIPGVTAEGVWENKKFGDREAWRAKHSIQDKKVSA